MRRGRRRRSRSPSSDPHGDRHGRKIEDIDEEMIRRKRAIEALREISERARRSRPPDATRP
jgi:hypothetical protein